MPDDMAVPEELGVIAIEGDDEAVPAACRNQDQVSLPGAASPAPFLGKLTICDHVDGHAVNVS
jgi:hypothetical protein